MAFFALLLGIPPLFVGIAIRADQRTWRGYGLALLALALLTLTLWNSIAFTQAPASNEALGIRLGEAVYFLYGTYLTLTLWTGALIEARKAQQRRWFVCLIGVAPLPWLLMLADSIVALHVRGLADDNFILMVLAVILPTLAVLAYGVARIIRPVQPVAPRRQAMPTR